MSSKLKREQDKVAREKEKKCIMNRVQSQNKQRESLLERAHSAKKTDLEFVKKCRQQSKIIIPPYKRSL